MTTTAQLANNGPCNKVVSGLLDNLTDDSFPDGLGYDKTTDLNNFASPPVASTVSAPNNGALVVALGDSVTSGHNDTASTTTCDDPDYSYANTLRGQLGRPMSDYTNVAHSGSTTSEVVSGTGYKFACNALVQPKVSELQQSESILSGSSSTVDGVNVAVGTGGINDTNWVALLAGLIGWQYYSDKYKNGNTPANRAALVKVIQDGYADAIVPTATDVSNAGNCSTWMVDNWTDFTNVGLTGTIALYAATIALGLMSAVPGAMVRYVGYYDFGTGSPTFLAALGGNPYFPPTCASAITKGVGWMYGIQRIGITEQGPLFTGPSKVRQLYLGKLIEKVDIHPDTAVGNGRGLAFAGSQQIRSIPGAAAFKLGGSSLVCLAWGWIMGFLVAVTQQGGRHPGGKPSGFVVAERIGVPTLRFHQVIFLGPEQADYLRANP